MNSRRSAARWLVMTAALIPLAGGTTFVPLLGAASPPLSPEDAALIKLNAGRRAFNEKNYPLAAATFKEFLAAGAGRPEAPSAWFGLGLCILQSPTPDLPAAIDALSHPAQSADFPDRPSALYYLGAAQASFGNHLSADALARPNEAATLNAEAAKHFTEAATQFAAAGAAFDKKIADGAAAAPAPAVLTADVEWSARARCDLAEMQLRLGRCKEALQTSAPFSADAVLMRSRYRPLGLYHLGYAQFMLRDYLSAGRALSQLAPFGQEFGPHARYLLGRVHHLSEERPEAAALYKAVIDDFEARKALAAKTPPDATVDAEHRAQLERLVHGPAPEFVARSVFYNAVLAYEDAHYADALDAFTKLIAADPNGPLAAECRLRSGFCQLQLKKFAEATAALDPLKDHKLYGDRALWWMARARLGAADPANAPAFTEALNTSLDMLRRAVAKAQELAPTDADAARRRIDILMELGDAQQVGKQFKEAAATYQQIMSEPAGADRAEEASQRKVTALHLAGQFADSDAAADLFLKTYPKSTLTAAVLFRQAENAYLMALAAADGKDARPRDEQAKLFTVAVDRCQKVVSKYPDFEYIDLARLSLAICQARLEHFPQAIAVLQTIPETSRDGELALVPYLLADCEIRTFPPEAEDALTAERLIQAAEDAAKSLEAFVGAQPKSPQAPDAMLKLGYCYQRIAEQMAAATERAAILAKAKDAYDRSTQQFPNDPTQPSVIFERAKVLADMGDVANAQNELGRFVNDPLHHTPNAPLAMLRLSALRRATGQAQAAADLMKKTREEFEVPLAADPERAAWVPMLRYENGVALQDLHKLPEARAIFEEIVKQFAGKADAVNAQWRAAQCRRQEAAAALVEARNVAARPGAADNDVTAAYVKADEPLKLLAQATEVLRGAADAQATAAANAEPTRRMLYELAWCHRVQADAETDAQRIKMGREAVEKVRSHWPKEAGAAPQALAAVNVSLADIPMQPSEERARAAYQRVIFAGPASPLACQARFELAELLTQRGINDEALDLLTAALENQPPRELTQRIKVRVAAGLLLRNNPQAALAQLRTILDDKDSPVAAEARFLAGQGSILQQDWTKAIEILIPFRDQDPFRTLPNLADRALSRLGYAFAQAKQWEPSRQTYEALVGRFPQSPLVDEARFGMGWALQNQQRWDEAANIYTDLQNHFASEAAARAMVNIGVCRLEQKRFDEALKFLQAEPLTYDYPDCTAAALYHGGRAFVELKQPDKARQNWERLVKESPSSELAALARQRLAELK